MQHLNTLLIATLPETFPAQLTAAYLTRSGAHREPTAELASVVPSLANGGITPDGKTVVFHLRPGLRWSDGAPLTARDVIFTTQRILAKDSPVGSTNGWDQIAAVDSPRPGDVRFRMKASYGPAIHTFFSSIGGYSILPEHALATVRDLRRASFNDLPIGSGPFKYSEFRRGDSIVMIANPFYFRGRPKLDKIVYKFVTDDNLRVTELLTGEVDMALRVPPTQLLRLRDKAGLSVVRTPSGFTTFMEFNTRHPPLDDIRVRRALYSALDRDAILAKVYHGAGSVSDDIVTPLDPFVGAPIPATPPDLKRAAQLLDASGWHSDATGIRHRHGRKLSIDVVTFATDQIGAAAMELVRAQWASIGESIASRRLNIDVFNALDGVAARGNFGSVSFGLPLESENLADTFGCASRSNSTQPCDRGVDELLVRADHSQNPVIRTKLYLEARRRIAAAASYIPIIHPDDIHFLRSGVTGFRPNGSTLFDDVMDLDRS
ncbi:MAG: peptide ABC transporter substrate-binding protein [Candidatus Eremiobacteraeota bacterium]|nr:peptide ABC transporter substrate-binding protein [Candidatus Eremiobacteraeota bacterium]